MKEGSKYQPLLEFLRGSNQREVLLTFAEIEALMNNPLPDSARSKRAWWSNRSKGALQASAWMEAGYRVENVDLDGQRVTFRKPTTDYQVQRVGDTVLWNRDLIKALRLHMGLTQVAFAQSLGVRQKTVSDWEKGAYAPTRSKSKHLELVAGIAGFRYMGSSESLE
ncbi:helix-turn-helix domain-containing protein [Coleofasciculus sp. FACHB-64]|uniref:helix-turn-helix domain-containing protein n=1 Tax=Cyanophyceae TaxID=3028117 RepID=UPI001683AE80|nr:MULTISPECIES: helix-turn-helix transcriptional regulator [unclassified Coleofasciculus]MBD1837899.1 helix-turn-helix domain-containing protein [Coleofasciculus sp. FACHB-501]MBD2044518.1 helix-turn-helix domain-containing protein [Coleofasciculus sp. FACHB-64]